MARKNQRAPWDEPEEDIIWVSKTEMKKELEEIQKLGEELTLLKPNVLETFPLTEELHTAIKDAQRFKQEARRRQLQYIGRLMKQLYMDEELDPIRAALDKYKNKHAQASHEFHRLEQLRDRLIAEGDSVINELINQHPDLDRQRMRQLVRQAKKEQGGNKPPKASREIFQILKGLDG